MKTSSSIFPLLGAVAGIVVTGIVLTATVSADDQLKSYSLKEVSEHKTEQDCWMAIEGKVYDFTKYIAQHPAGPGVMIDWCGSDAEDGMRTKGIGDDHSPDAWEQAEAYMIGTLK